MENMEDRTEVTLRKLASPYNLRETLGWIVRNFCGIRKNRKDEMTGLPQSYLLNENISNVSTAIFVGDIMDMKKRTLRFGEKLKEFVKESDFLVGNFEATLTNDSGAIMAQRHTPEILDSLENLFPPQQTYLSVANNHAGDFGSKIFMESVNHIKSLGFHVFGMKSQQFVDIGKNVRILAGSMWSNQKCPYLGDIVETKSLIHEDKFNILYPHWGYELEQYPRRETVLMAQKFISDFDAIIGHHSHNPQPMEKKTGKPNKLVAYSLGDFCIWETLKHYLYGIVMKIEIGKDSSDVMQIGKIEWRYVKSEMESEPIWVSEISEKYPYI
jgi:hypothetical protein